MFVCGLSCRHRSCGDAALTAPHRDVLRVRREAELAAVLAAAVVRQRSDQLTRRRNKHLQRRIAARARRFNTQDALVALVFRACDAHGIG